MIKKYTDHNTCPLKYNKHNSTENNWRKKTGLLLPYNIYKLIFNEQSEKQLIIFFLMYFIKVCVVFIFHIFGRLCAPGFWTPC